MKIYTSYFGQVKNLKNENLVIVSIARYMPRFMSSEDRKTITEMKHLAPTGDMLKLSEAEYTPRFNDILSKLSSKAVCSELQALSDRNNGKDVVLLCYEKIGDWCHRHMVAKWITQETGMIVEEYITSAQKPKPVQKEIF